MNKSQIQGLLTSSHEDFVNVFKELNQDQFTKSVNNKWSPGQQLDHIIRAVSPVALAFQLPTFVPKIMFGHSSRPSKTYEALVEKYHTKIAAGGRAVGRFIPKGTAFNRRQNAINKLQRLVLKLNKAIESKSEKELDFYILPHPLLGKVTFREMLYFTAYHAQHHKNSTIKNLEASK